MGFVKGHELCPGWRQLMWPGSDRPLRQRLGQDRLSCSGLGLGMYEVRSLPKSQVEC
ncbi:MAG: hypothetical protein EBE86_020160 [Hormoscilla sp. GUM202]|nr:hypothetical protein [Hormoscilla sp. GUM202]